MNPHASARKDFYISILLSLISGLTLSLAGAFGKQLTVCLGLSLAIFFRYFIPFLLLVVIYFFSGKRKTAKIAWGRAGLRALFAVVSQYCFFYLLWHGSILIAILLYSTNGLISPFLARLFLKQVIKLKTLISIAIGFVGVVVTIGPVHSDSYISLVIGVLSGFFAACSQLSLHNLSKSQDPVTINIVMFGLATVIATIATLIQMPYTNMSLLLGLLHWKMLMTLLLFAIFSVTNQLLKTAAYKRINKVASLVPFFYSALIYSAIIDWVWLGQAPMWYTYVGICIIIISGVVMAIRKKIVLTESFTIAPSRRAGCGNPILFHKK